MPNPGEGPTSPGGLPPAVDAQVAELVRVLAAEPRVESVILLGSAARGELVTATVDGRPELFGDLELLAVTEGRLPAARRRELAAAIDTVGGAFGYRSPSFHVEVLFRERRRMSSFLPLVFTHELATNGRVLYGADVLGEVRPVTARTLDRQNTHEILMKRLMAIAEAVPPGVAGGAASDELALRAYRVALARNPLDVPTVLLPEAGVLLSTYQERVSYWSDHPRLPFRAALDLAAGGNSTQLLEACMRQRNGAGEEALVSHAQAVRFLVAALAWLLHCAEASVADAVAHRSRALFHELPVTPGEVIGMSSQLRDLARSVGFLATVRWATARRKGRLTTALLHLHGALDHIASGDADAAHAALARARAAAAPVAPDWPVPPGTRDAAAPDGPALPPPRDDWALGGADPAPPEAALARGWLDARLLVARGFWRTVRLGDPAAWDRTAAVLGVPEPTT